MKTKIRHPRTDHPTPHNRNHRPHQKGRFARDRCRGFNYPPDIHLHLRLWHPNSVICGLPNPGADCGCRALRLHEELNDSA
jgi:hypothetical protein